MKIKVAELPGKCARCGDSKSNTSPDSCLGELPGVVNACCGHGKEGFIMFENGVTIRGNFHVDLGFRCSK